jgi:uncharacterized membrane protein
MTDLKRLQEACKIVANYPTLIETMKNNPGLTQAQLARTWGSATLMWLTKIIIQMHDVGFVTEISNDDENHKRYILNEDRVKMVQEMSITYANLVSAKI